MFLLPAAVARALATQPTRRRLRPLEVPALAALSIADYAVYKKLQGCLLLLPAKALPVSHLPRLDAERIPKEVHEARVQQLLAHGAYAEDLALRQVVSDLQGRVPALQPGSPGGVELFHLLGLGIDHLEAAVGLVHGGLDILVPLLEGLQERFEGHVEVDILIHRICYDAGAATSQLGLVTRMDLHLSLRHKVEHRVEVEICCHPGHGLPGAALAIDYNATLQTEWVLQQPASASGDSLAVLIHAR
mmetsp:Transcript_68464/g.155103  ORF Transcript_68464/g.155103 Transcript_68464/m.155103 type:complete len:246 (+) Transcript_68464:24-761(+)